jgi:PRP38 family
VGSYLQYGNTTTFNFESVLRQNVLQSEYFRNTCSKLDEVEALVDQIYYDVQHVEPWMSGNARGPSSAFCLLYRCVGRPHSLPFYTTRCEKSSMLLLSVSCAMLLALFQAVAVEACTADCELWLRRFAQLGPSEKDVMFLLDHGDSPYIRAVCRQRLRPNPVPAVLFSGWLRPKPRPDSTCNLPVSFPNSSGSLGLWWH